MTTRLEASNTMLNCVGQSPIKTLEGTKSYYTITAEQILEKECKLYSNSAGFNYINYQFNFYSFYY